MLLGKDLKKLFSQLVQDDHAQISLGNSDITIRVIDNATKLALSTPVYFGGNYIPSSVRKCVGLKAPFTGRSAIKTNLAIDEKNYMVILSYLGSIEHLDNVKFKELIEEFGWLAEEWRLYLDERDKNDLVHVRVK